MLRFIRLCRNEWIKIFSRLTVYIMAGVLLIVCLGFGFLNRQAQNQHYFYNGLSMEEYEKSWKTYLGTQINLEKQYLAEYKETGAVDHSHWNNGYFDTVSSSENYDLQTYYDEYISGLEYMLAKEIRTDDWRSNALDAVALMKSRLAVLESGSAEYNEISADINSFWGVITKDDWKEYLTLDLNASLLSQIRKMNSPVSEEIDREIVRIRKKYDIKPYVYPFLSDYYLDYDEDWREEELDTYGSFYNVIVTKLDFQGNAVAKKDLGQYKESLKLSEFKLANNTPSPDSNTAAGHLASGSGLVLVISLCLIVLAGNLVASEYTSGTVKLLLISPHKRWKILLSKYVVLFVVSFIMLILLLLFSMLSGIIFFGFTGFGDVAFSLFGGYVKMPVILFILIKYLLRVPELLVMTSLAVMLSVIMRHSAVAIGAGTALLFGGSLLTQLLRYIPYDWKRFLLQANTDLSVYFPSLSISDIFESAPAPFMPDMTFGFSLLILAAYFICINCIALDSFYRRDIK